MKPNEYKRQIIETSLMSTFAIRTGDGSKNLIDDSVFEFGQEKPYESTSDLVHLYASNLRNGGSPAGPTASRLGAMTKHAFNESGFIEENKLTRFNISQFCSHAADFVKTQPLSNTGGHQNETILRAIAAGENAAIHRRLLFNLVKSIEQFSLYLIDKHGGSARSFSDQFMTKIEGNDPKSKSFKTYEFRHQLLKELKFPLMGPAITSNFLKDSQIGRARNIANLAEIHLGGLAKPDMHVMRIMLVVTGRVSVEDEEGLSRLCHEDNFVKIYKTSTPGNDWPIWPSGLSGEDKCLNDLNYLSFCNDYPALFLDRVFFIAGSGRSQTLEPNGRPKQLRRYRTFLRGMNLLRYSANNQ
jgi:hypothetical protein